MKNIIFDAHQDILIHERDKDKKITQTGFGELVKSSIKMVVASVFLEPEKIAGLNSRGRIKFAESQIKDYLKIIKKNKNLMLIKNKNDLMKLMQTDATGILIHIEGLDFINERNVNVIDYFYDLGLRSAGLVWGEDNNIGGYSGSNKGLTNFGKKLVQNLNDKKIIIDLAHTNKKTFYDVMAISLKPVMVSHGNCYKLCKDGRNFKQRQLRLLAQKKGVQGIFFSGKYVSKKKNILIQDVVEHFYESYKISPELTILGTDFGGISSGFAQGLNNINQLPQLIKIVERQLGKEAVKKISYSNFFNFLEKSI